MDEKPTDKSTSVRPTRKQKALLDFIDTFIAEHGFSPSYREVKDGLNYNSVATVSLHINNLIKRGHLQKRDHSARSLEVVHTLAPKPIKTNQIMPAEEKWLVDKIENAFTQVEASAHAKAEGGLDNLYVLIGALKVLGLEAAAQSFMPRLKALKSRKQ